MSTGVLLTNLGTPDAPTTSAVRKYLAEFLKDPRVVEIPSIIWLPILYSVILPFRAPKSAKLYQKIWTDKGSPLRFILEEQVNKLRIYLDSRFRGNDEGGSGNDEREGGNDEGKKGKGEDERDNKIIVMGAMRYGTPSIEAVIQNLIQKKIKKLILLPLYPQYSAATTATTFDEVARVFKSLRVQPELKVINYYYNNENYISAIVESIKSYWRREGQTQKLLFSFHGLPESFIQKGDIYYDHCQETVKLITAALKLNSDQWIMTFQSRLGKTEWLKPYTDRVLKQLPGDNIKKITVICPGFSADCLETLEEINMTNRALFLKSGGEVFHYIPALNANDHHIEMLGKLVEKHI